MGLALSDYQRDSARWLGIITIAILLLSAGGCSTQSSSGLAARCLQHQALVAKNGLHDPEILANLKISAALPEGWERLPLDTSILYTHQQWRSPSLHTGVGVAYIHLPIPVSAKMLIWFAELQYSKSPDANDGAGGRLIGAWTDSLGRAWFEAENSKYHVRGYAMTKQFDAWIVYSGYRVTAKPNFPEISLAQRCADAIAPLNLGPSKPNNVPYSTFAAATR